ncbi:MAG: class I SAM-dependent methyltransferase [Polynucleobacter sp.]|nr:class I SAM-dependent methyltransferase [Polynucleobacter sp.]
MMQFGRIKWALRKAFLPVKANTLVLDVGSGNSPYPRSDVLLDRLEGDAHRCGQALIIDRPLVFGDALHMPFKDKAFDFVVASHILEHMKNPEQFLSELSRVAKAGYIETPNSIGEELVPMNIHCLEVMNLDSKLVIRKKASAQDVSFLGDLKIHIRNPAWSKLFHRSPDLFHTRYFWQDQIDYEILNPEVSCDWIDQIYTESDMGESSENYRSKGWRGWGIRLLAKLYGWRRNRKSIDINAILACPQCHSDLNFQNSSCECLACGAKYSLNPYPDFSNKV